MTVELMVNGQSHRTDPVGRLLDVLRAELGILSVREGCGEGLCGTCVVLIGGVARLSCLLLAGRVSGDITTLEGLGSDDLLDAVVSELRAAAAVQCGFCAPGFVLETYAECVAARASSLTPARSRADRVLRDHVCRCSGYVRLRAAIASVIDRVQQGVLPMRPANAQGLFWTTRVGPVELEVRVPATCLVRTPGFPMRTVDRLAAPELLDAADKLAGADAAIGRERESFLRHRWPVLRSRADAVRGAVPMLYRAHKAVSHHEPFSVADVERLAQLSEGDWVDRWQSLVRRRNELEALVRKLFAEALGRGAERVISAVLEDRARHAVFVSNPRLYRDVLARRLGEHTGPVSVDGELVAAVRRPLLTAHRYLRRFTTRCETASFFGPATFARFDESEPEAVRIGSPQPETSFVEASTWLTDELLARVTERVPLAERLVWRSPLFTEMSGLLRHALTGKRYRVKESSLRLWQLAGGRDRLGELAARAGVAPADLPAAVRGLGPALVVAPVLVPATEPRPTAMLVAAGADAEVARIAALLRDFSTAPWPDRMHRYQLLEEAAAELGIATRRNAGQHYADRELLHEDRSGPLSEQVTFGRPVVAALREAVGAVLSICYLGALLRREDARAALRAVTGGRATPFAELAARDLPESEPRWERLRSRLAELVAAQRGGDVVELSTAQLRAATADLWDLVDAGDRTDPCLPSPDFMIAGPDPETGQWILSELHDDCSTVFGGIESQVHSTPSVLFDEFRGAVRELLGDRAMATIVARRRNAHITPELPGLSLELSGLSCQARESTRPIADVPLAPDARGVLVDGTATTLYPGDLPSALHRAVALPSMVPVPIETGPYTPRVVIDGVVYQRARWRITLPRRRSRSAFDRWRAQLALRQEHRLPRRVYVRHPAEPKPLYVDFADPIALLDLARLTPDEVVVTEMLPAPEQLWWGSGRDRQCAELRVGVLVRGLPEKGGSC